jgi:8-oxo-dGTP pyrophosphatase MutT (NUDIX family)
VAKEISAGAIIFREDKGRIFYLLLSYTSSGRTKREYWGFAKGHIESGENAARAARREIEEETGLKGVSFIKGFRESEKYFFMRGKEKIFKVVIFFLTKTQTKEIKLSFEHNDFKWLPYEEAVKWLTFKNAKKILTKANDFLSRESLSGR